MFNFYNRHYIFKQSNGEIRDIYCDSRQNLCISSLTRRGMWSEATVLNRNVHQYFYAELDQSNACHILFQDSSGNINYTVLEGQSARTIPVLSSKTPSVYNKHLYIAPLKDSIYLFYVLQHDNSFLLAYQQVSKNKAGTPRIVDYVSGSNIPCAVLYDSSTNIYAFYQSYDGKYLQLGYKKFNTSQRHWSDFTPVTRYNGNCEYPHAIIDSGGTIHLCYQRRAPKMFEMVYQQKAPDKNLWSAETVLHSSIHSFENASILQVEDKVVVYWIRDDMIYYNVAPLSGENWSKPARYGGQLGRQFQCICYKDQILRTDFNRTWGQLTGTVGQGTGGQVPYPALEQRDRQGDSSSQGEIASLSPGIYPGTVANGFKLAFTNADSVVGGSPFPQFPPAGRDGVQSSGEDIKNLVLSAFKQMQDNISEIRTGWTDAKKEMSKLTNAYIELTKEINKYTIRLNMLENKLSQLNNPYRKAESVKSEENAENLGISYNGTFSSREAFAKPENYSLPDKSPAKSREAFAKQENYSLPDKSPAKSREAFAKPENYSLPDKGPAKSQEAFAKPENYSLPDKSPTKSREAASAMSELNDHLFGQSKKSDNPIVEETGRNAEDSTVKPFMQNSEELEKQLRQNSEAPTVKPFMQNSEAPTVKQPRQDPEAHKQQLKQNYVAPDKQPKENVVPNALPIDSTPDKKPGSSLDPDALKAWEEWQEPKEWSDGG